MNAIPELSSISASEYIPAVGGANGIRIKKEGQDDDEFLDATYMSVNGNFLDNLSLELIEGRHFEDNGLSDSRSIIVNQAMLKELGYSSATQAIGQNVYSDKSEEALLIVGVVEDFRVRMLMEKDEVAPLVLQNNPKSFYYVNVKVGGNNVQQTIAKINNKWSQVYPGQEFKYEFFDQQLFVAYQAFRDGFVILRFFAFTAMTIACLGMLGMVIYTTERRMKEVALRKVLCAEDSSIVFMLSKQFLKLLLISAVIAAPMAYFVNDLWLTSIPNKVGFGFGTIFLGIIVLFLIGILTIGIQTFRAAKSNPLKFLKIS